MNEINLYWFIWDIFDFWKRRFQWSWNKLFIRPSCPYWKNLFSDHPFILILQPFMVSLFLCFVLDVWNHRANQSYWILILIFIGTLNIFKLIVWYYNGSNTIYIYTYICMNIYRYINGLLKIHVDAMNFDTSLAFTLWDQTKLHFVCRR